MKVVLIALVLGLTACVAGPRYTVIKSYTYSEPVTIGGVTGTSTAGTMYVEESSTRPEGWEEKK